MSTDTSLAHSGNSVLAEKTLKSLQSAIASRGDFPAMSREVQQIVHAMRDDFSYDFDLTKAVLSDVALTQKVIRLANSAMYSVFGGNITTVSRAIYVLGTDAVGHLALSLKLLDQLDKASSELQGARGEFHKAMLAGTIARKITEGLPPRESEESVVCTLLYNLGRLLVAFYLPTHWNSIVTRSVVGTYSEQIAALDVLGLSFPDIGKALALEWNLPVSFTNAMSPPDLSIEHPLSHTEWLATLANYASICSETLIAHSSSGAPALNALTEKYAQALGFDIPHLEGVLTKVLTEERALIQLSSDTRPIVSRADAGSTDVPTRLALGLRDMQALATTARLETLAGLMIEVMRASLGLQQVFVFLRDSTSKTLSAKLALGPGAQELTPMLTFGEAFEPDVFHFSLAQNQPVFIANAHAANLQQRLPRWFKSAFPNTRSFLAMPLVIGNTSVGLIYGNWPQAAESLTLAPAELSVLLAMRDVLLTVGARQALRTPNA